MPTNRINKGRLVFVYICIVLAFLSLVARMAFITIKGDNAKINKTYNSQGITKRANIIDRNGVIIASDLQTKSLYISTILIKNPKETAKQLTEIFPNLDYGDILSRITKNQENSKWILVRRNLTPSQQNKVQNLKMAGLLFEDDLVRAYPQKSIASHVAGYTDSDRIGLSGIERAYNKELSNNKEIQLALDIRVQDVLSDQMGKAVKYYKAKAAAGIIINVNNGEIIALCSLPDFDLNNQSSANSNERFNRVTTGIYELGSVFKIFTNTIAIEENLVKLTDIIDVKEPIKVGRFTIRDDHFYKDKLTVSEVFDYSSNIGTIKIAQKFGVEKQKKFLKELNLLDKLDVNFPGLSRTIYPQTWREANLYTIAYGHGIAVTPLHMANSVSAIINGGTMYQPSFIKLSKQPTGKKVISKNTSDVIKKMMRDVVTYGTGKNSNIDGYEIAGKTGTAERAEFGGYSEKKTIASFIATFPISEPKYLLFILFDQPNYTFNTGGMVAAPVAKSIIQNIAPILEIEPIETKFNL